MSTNSPKKWRIVRWFLWALVLFFLLGLFIPMIVRSRSGAKIRAQSEVTQVRAAVKAYRVEYGISPTGDPARVLAILRGDNPRKIVFFEADPGSFNTNGELIDPWGTPYLFDLADPDFPRIWSCGKNRQDEGGAMGSDDVVSWR